ncbi:MAG: phage tail protein [Ectothiorhodospiraceae bacterium]|nr:phage tail protein [Ectothiorhodospiraceae bacterium]MCH8505568.1 tail fiber protein [Ectothiorhodospiraceae bacterium]
MADPFLAEIRVLPFGFAPRGWALCDGQLMPLSQNTALFSLLGTMYGGDGKSTFALPDLRERTPIHPGQGQGLELYDIAQTGGAESVALETRHLPAHSHQVDMDLPPDAAAPRVAVATIPGNSNQPGDGKVLAAASGSTPYAEEATQQTDGMIPAELGITGQGNPHSNMPPYLTFNFVIALQGIFPSRN